MAKYYTFSEFLTESNIIDTMANFIESKYDLIDRDMGNVLVIVDPISGTAMDIKLMNNGVDVMPHDDTESNWEDANRVKREILANISNKTKSRENSVERSPS